MATATDIVKSALRRITSYQSGETIAALDMADCMETFMIYSTPGAQTNSMCPASLKTSSIGQRARIST